MTFAGEASFSLAQALGDVFFRNEVPELIKQQQTKIAQQQKEILKQQQEIDMLRTQIRGWHEQCRMEEALVRRIACGSVLEARRELPADDAEAEDLIDTWIRVYGTDDFPLCDDRLRELRRREQTALDNAVRHLSVAVDAARDADAHVSEEDANGEDSEEAVDDED